MPSFKDALAPRMSSFKDALVSICHDDHARECASVSCGEKADVAAVPPAAQVPAAQSALASSSQKSRRQQVAKACLACRQAKAKCSADRPCTRCIRAGMSASCFAVDKRPPSSADYGVVAVIERPVDYKPDRALLGFTGGNFHTAHLDVMIAENGLQWLSGPIQRSTECGFDARTIIGIFASLPDDWIALLKGTCQALQVLERNRVAMLTGDARGQQTLLYHDEVMLLCMECAGSGTGGALSLEKTWRPWLCRWLAATFPGAGGATPGPRGSLRALQWHTNCHCCPTHVMVACLINDARRELVKCVCARNRPGNGGDTARAGRRGERYRSGVGIQQRRRHDARGLPSCKGQAAVDLRYEILVALH